MSRGDKVLISRVFVAIALVLFVIALILEIIELFSPGSGAFSSLHAFGTFVVGELITILAIILTFLLLAGTYTMIYSRLKGIKSAARDYALGFGIISIILALIFLGTFVLGAGVALIIAWIILLL
jgi:hypothetical protein